ncbi:hypothetical protein BUQ74_01670 [Leptospira weilii serovar Heyan]|nr:hypothetical protein BUQ74_01670 [Leptospira weilii serovar Heyan]
MTSFKVYFLYSNCRLSISLRILIFLFLSISVILAQIAKSLIKLSKELFLVFLNLTVLNIRIAINTVEIIHTYQVMTKGYSCTLESKLNEIKFG